MPAKKLRIAVLECDVPLPNIQQRHGNYGKIFTTLLTKAAKVLSARGTSLELHVQGFDVINHVYPDNLDGTDKDKPKWDAILISGSSMCPICPHTYAFQGIITNDAFRVLCL
jgi:hypothetical protein